MLDPQAPERVVSPEAVAPPQAALSVISLWRSPSRVWWLLAIGVLSFFLILAGIGAATDGSIETGGRIVLGGVGVAVLARVLTGTVQAFRATFGDTPYLEVHPELGLRIHDRIVLRGAPFEIPRASLRAAALESAGPKRRRGFGSSLARFPVEGASAWCWVAREGSRLPRLGHARDVPNLALVFTEPVPAPRVRRGSRVWMFGHPPHGRVQKGDPLSGVLLTVRDAEKAAEVLAVWGLGPALDTAALDAVDPRPPSRRRAARWARVAVALFVVYLVVGALGAFQVL